MAKAPRAIPPNLNADSSNRMKWFPLVLIIAAGAAYANSFEGAFVFDDNHAIRQNMRIRSLWPLDAVLSGRRPVMDLSLAVNYAIGGLNPKGYHFVNLLIHIATAVTLFGTLGRAFRTPRLISRFSTTGPWIAAATALVWVVHPLQTESVTYLAQRGESLMGLFYVLTLYCVLRGAESARSVGWYILAITSCGLGMGTKAVMVTAPVVVMLMDRPILADSWRQVVARRWWVYVGLGATWIVLFINKVAPSVLFPAHHVTGTVGFAFKGMTPLDYAMTQPGVIGHYLWLTVWPWSLCLDYQWPVATSIVAWLPWAIVIGGAVAAGAWAYIRKPALGSISVWFFLILAPTSSVIPIKDPAFEHRMYLPLAAVVLLLVLLGDAAIRALAERLRFDAGRRRWMAGGVLGVVVLSLCVGTVRRNRDYRSEVIMWTDVVSKRPENTRAHYNLGKAHLDQRDSDGAVAALNAALAIDPGFVEARYNLGKAFAQQGRTEEAAAQYVETLRIDPTMAKARSDLGNTLVRSGRVEEGIEHYRECIRIDPEYVRTYVNLGSVLLARGEVEEAVTLLQKAVALAPRTARVRFSLGRALQAQGNRPEAMAEFRRTLELTPGHPGALRALEELGGR